jgi:SAM-dependent methyltransferase
VTQGLVLPGRGHGVERMDVEAVSDTDLARCLRDLERVNVASLGHRPTLAWLDRVARGRSRISVLDVGSGGGDMLRRIWRWGRRRGIATELTGLDVNPAVTQAATARTPAEMAIRFETADIFDYPRARAHDVILSALFAHPLDDAAVPRFLRWMEDRAAIGWMVNDLHRHPVPYHGLRLAFAALPVHRFVRHDGPVSVQRGFSRADLLRSAEAADLGSGEVELTWWFPFRWRLARVKARA